MVWAWMLWSPYALGTRTELWFGHVSQHQGVHGFVRSRGSVRRLMGFGGSWVHGVQGFAELPGFAGVVGSRVHGFAVFAGSHGSRVRGFAGSRVRGFAGSRVRGFAGSRVRGFAGARVRGFAG